MRVWIAPAVIAGLIFAASSIPGKELPSVPIAGFDKVEHGSIYALLGAGTARALLATSSWPAIVVIAAATAGCSAYGASDEFHQRFTPNRSVDRMDWAADTAGGLAGASAWSLVARRRRGR